MSRPQSGTFAVEQHPAQRPSPRRTGCGGYTLIEVLLAATIVLLSMTGMFTMQMVGIKVTQGSYHRTQATTLAYQMTDYLRANCGATSDYTGQTLCRAGSRAVNDERGCDVDEPADIVDTTTATDDLSTWWQAIDNSGLPNWYATVVNPEDSDLFHVIIQWDDTRATETSADAEEGKTSCVGTAIPAPMEEVCLTTTPCAL